MEDSEEMTKRPVAPPRRKKKTKSNYESPVLKHESTVQAPAAIEAINIQQLPKADSPTQPKRPPKPRPRAAVSTSAQEKQSCVDSGSRNQPRAELQSSTSTNHFKLQRQSSGQRPAIVPRVLSPDKNERVRPKTFSQNSQGRSLADPPRPSSSLSSTPSTEHTRTAVKRSISTNPSSPESPSLSTNSQHRRSSLVTKSSSVEKTSTYSTIPRQKHKNKSKRTNSEPNENNPEETQAATVINTRSTYLNVAPRQPIRTPQPKVSFSDAYGQRSKVAKKTSHIPKSKSIDSPTLSRNKQTTNFYSSSSPSQRNRKQPIELQVQQKTTPLRRVSKPARPAPPPPHKVAHYAIYTEILPKGAPQVPQDDMYSYVRVNPGMSRNVQGLDLEGGSSSRWHRPRIDSTDSYVNSDYDGPQPRAAASLTEDMYMPLTDKTLSGTQDIYVVPTHGKLRRSSLHGDVLLPGECESDEADYMIPDDAHHVSHDPTQPIEGDIYMSLSNGTLEESSIYQCPSLVSQT